MLVLRRTCGQSIVIGDQAEIIVKVLREENGTISIGIDAPRSMPVDRLEKFEKRILSKISTEELSDEIIERLKCCSNHIKHSFSFINNDRL